MCVCVCALMTYVCVFVSVCVCMRLQLHMHTSEFNCPIACQGVVHSTDIQVWRFDTKHRLTDI